MGDIALHGYLVMALVKSMMTVDAMAPWEVVNVCPIGGSVYKLQGARSPVSGVWVKT